ncbi:MAG: glucose/galactose MFS transporter [Novosphingobium sp.]|uniref:glucose/galactose MFS transporter n=1 Tax=Novosphingobium sp. TaxID=1874826 RepID=UPI001809F396|nr:glucose/galactose MFS transporter [Novosphingobium sp.]
MERLRALGITGAFVSVTTLFLAWGFIASNNDPLIVALRAAFHLNYTEALAIQLVSFLAYGLMSLPAASLGNRIGPVTTILIALGLMIAGCTAVRLVLPLDSYGAILAALFVLAVGITALQVSANPLAAALGPVHTSHFRLNFAQTFNSLGVVMGVNYGASVMLGEKVIAAGQGQVSGPVERAEVLQAVGQAFTLMAVLLATLAAFFWTQRRRIAAAAEQLAPAPQASVLDALHSRWARFGALAIGLYVGAEVSIGSIMINFLHRDAILGLPLEDGGRYLANLYWGGALAGRFIGSILLTRVRATWLLGLCAAMAAVLCGVALADAGPVSGFAALAVGLFNSIMFPTIFSLTLERSGVSQSSTSGLLCLAIVGGAALPFLVGRLADTTSLAWAFVVPAAAYLVIAGFAWRAGTSRIVSERL